MTVTANDIRTAKVTLASHINMGREGHHYVYEAIEIRGLAYTKVSKPRQPVKLTLFVDDTPLAWGAWQAAADLINERDARAAEASGPTLRVVG